MSRTFLSGERLFQEGNYLNDKREGEWKVYDKKGSIEKIINYVNDKLHGEKKEYEQGVLKKIAPYVNDKENGTTIYFYTNEEHRGKIYAIGDYINGKPEGEWKIFWENGQISEIENYKNGLKEGTFKNFGSVIKSMMVVLIVRLSVVEAL